MMFIKARLSSVFIIAAAFVFMFVSFNSLASAQSGTEGVGDRQIQSKADGTINYVVPGGPGFVSIAGITFTPTSHNVEWDTGYGYLSNPSTTIDGSYIAPVYLPQGAIVNQVVFFYYDADIEHDLEVTLYRKTAGSSEFMTMSSIDSVGDVEWAYVVDETVEYSTIDNQEYSYLAIVSLPGGAEGYLGFDHLRVDYSFPNYLAFVTK